MTVRRVIDMSNPPDLTFTPSTVEEEVIQSIYLILNTFKHTVPCYRDYGLSPDWLHRPLPAAQQAYSVALQKALMDYEPRDRKSTRLNSSHPTTSRMPSSA